MNLKPFRKAFGNEEIAGVQRVISYYKKSKIDPPYSGIFEKKLCKKFSSYMNGGYSKAVATGTSASFVAIQSLQLDKDSEILVSAVNDSGPFNSIIALGLTPKLIDSSIKNYNASLEEIKKRISKKTKACLIAHIGGRSTEIYKIKRFLKIRKIKLIEDFSQAPGAECYECKVRCKGCIKKKVGEFGDVSFVSTMYRKSISSGGSGGLIFTKDKKIYKKILAYSDRGKKIWSNNINLNDPSKALFPGLNHNTNEFTCAITAASLSRLNKNNHDRRKILQYLIKKMKPLQICSPSEFNNGFAPFFFPIYVDEKKLKCSKSKFVNQLIKKGIGLLPEYNCIISKWKWADRYLSDKYICKNAISISKKSFNLFINENYNKKIIDEIIKIIALIEKQYKI
jgi:perosamine synthetase